MPTITADTTVSFPVAPSYGFISSPYYESTVARRESGFERVNLAWAQALVYLESVPVEDLPVEELEQVRDFYHVMGGRAGYFRIRDWGDYRSAGVNETLTALDQPLVEIGSTGTYQIVRQYSYSGLIRQRQINKPVGDTILVADELGNEETDWTLDEATGIITPGAGFSGTPTTWGGLFDIEARFNSNLDMDIQTYGTRSARVQILERRVESTI